MKAIETYYEGFFFRSRLEARWAVFFNTIGANWQYEVEGFQLNNRMRYLPDFKVMYNGITYWYEVKPKGDPGNGKLEQFAHEFFKAHEDTPGQFSTQFRVVSGDPIDCIESGFRVCPRCGNLNMPDECNFCEACYATTPHGNRAELEDGLIVPVIAYNGNIFISDHDGYTEKVNGALDSARSARFEGHYQTR